MKTDDLMNLLATGATPVPRHAGERRFALALGLGLVGALAWVHLMYGVRSDLGEVWATSAFGVKLAMPLAVAVSGLAVVFRLAHPGARVRGWAWGLWLPVALLWAWAMWVLAQAAPGTRAALVLGETWRYCVFNVMATALPVGVALFWALRGLAPTRPMLTGAAAGWLAGAVGAVVYALHCPEMQAPFLAVWYVLGMAACALLGALAGRRWLRW